MQLTFNGVEPHRVFYNDELVKKIYMNDKLVYAYYPNNQILFCPSENDLNSYGSPTNNITESLGIPRCSVTLPDLVTTSKGWALFSVPSDTVPIE